MAFISGVFLLLIATSASQPSLIFFTSSNKNFSLRDLLAEYAKEIQDPEHKVRRLLKLC